MGIFVEIVCREMFQRYNDGYERPSCLLANQLSTNTMRRTTRRPRQNLPHPWLPNPAAH